MTVVTKTEYQRPVDRGWAWVVMCAIFLQLFLNVGISKSFGLFFIQFIIVYKTSASLISGVIALQTAMFSLSCGGCALTLGPGLVVLSSYFEKRRGFANSISNVGASIGSLVFPKIIQVLIDVYGLQGALIFVSGILFHNLIVAMLLRPLPPSVETAGSIQGNIEKEELLKYPKRYAEFSESANPKTVHHGKRSNKDVRSVCSRPNQNISSSFEEESPQLLNDKVDDTLKQLKETSGLSYNEKKDKEMCRSSLDLCTSTGSISCSIQNLTYFCIFSCGLTITYIPPFARENNNSDEEIALLVMIFGACDVVARFSIAWIADSKRIKRTYILGITLLITGTVTMFNTFFTNFTSYIRDSTGSYNVTFYVIGVGMIIGALALFCDSWVMKLEEQRLQKNREVDSEVE
ncbi:monocarboxylate transporter 9-like [Mytilus californianus]|uniref:monocarboxylate transporter 9-like n=1 Tax=Mytilus californianus TaxID=6549 RepID=UPI0022453F0D|nr:monocarboxylate transporter 9-like [Mytilus californianus]